MMPKSNQQLENIISELCKRMENVTVRIEYLERIRIDIRKTTDSDQIRPKLKSRIPENLLDPGSWHDPSLKTVMRLMSHEVELHEKSDNDWKRGYVRAMTVVYGWLEDLLERRDDEGPEESSNASGR